MTNEELKMRLNIPIEEDSTPVEVKTVSEIQTAILHNGREVIASYQNANKWLDTIKEELLMQHGLVFFSNYIHELAHTMPERFDKFGAIMHRANMKVPYPATSEFLKEDMSMESIFEYVFVILDSIADALVAFIKCTQDTPFRSLASSSEELLIDLEEEASTLNRFLVAYERCNGDLLKFDQWVACYLANKDKLID